MGELFIKLLNMSITAGWLVIIVSCIRFFFRKIPKWIICLLWGIVAIRLMIPFTIESNLSLQPSSEPIQTSTVVDGEVLPYIPVVDSQLPFVEHTVNPILKDTFTYEETDSVAPLQIVTKAAGYVWFAGMLFLLLFGILSTVSISLRTREAVAYRENSYLCDAVNTPFIMGIIRPRIFLPSDLQENEIEFILAHEKAHLKRRDYLWKPLGYLLLCVYWFNPLCIAAYILLCKDIELACDEKVIRDMSMSDKKEYSRILLSCATNKHFVLAYPLAFGEVGVKERVKTVLHYKKAAAGITILAIIVAILTAVCFLTNPSKEYQVRITIPAGNADEYCYSELEISPKGKTICVSCGENLGDTEVVLLPVEIKKENAYEQPVYLTRGLTVKLEAEKGGWFKIGVKVQNPSSEDKNVYITVQNVEVRIASTETTEAEKAESQYLEELVEKKEQELVELHEYVEELQEEIEQNAANNSETKATQEISMQELVRIVSSNSFADTQKEEGLQYWDVYHNLVEYEEFDQNSQTGLRYAQLEFDDRVYELQIYYIREETLTDDGEKINEIDGIYLWNVQTDDCMLLYSADGRYSANADIEEFLTRQYKLPPEIMNGDYASSKLSGKVSLSTYGMDFFLNFAGYYFVNDSYQEPTHGDGAPVAWYSLGGIGECVSPDYSEREVFTDGCLTEYRYIDNHMSEEFISSFVTDDYSGCLYHYNMDLVTAAEVDLLKEGESGTSDYWVVFFTEGEGKPLYMKFFNCNYYTMQEALDYVIR